MNISTKFKLNTIKPMGTAIIVRIKKAEEMKAKDAGIILPTDDEIQRFAKKEANLEGRPNTQLAALNNEIFLEVISASVFAEEQGVTKGTFVLIHPGTYQQGMSLPYEDEEYFYMLFDFNGIIAKVDKELSKELN